MALILASMLSFSSPVTHELTLAGNFGEPRPNHFHGGIDVKTEGVEGKAILSIADGYVSRVTVGLFGFGNAVYVQHPGGYTSVYCHLKRFSPQIAAAVKRYQYKHQSYVADVRLKATDCPVSCGQVIATSGNTGSSQAPHLHLEVHDTRTWDMLDPLNLLKDLVKDAMPPQAHGFMAIPQEGDGIFNGASNKQVLGFGSHHLSQSFTAWGRVGFAIWGNDYMEATYNHYGIRYTRLTVDGREVYMSDVNRIPMKMNRQVNTWGDYEHKLRSNVWYMKSYAEPGCRLPILSVDNQRGIISFDEERDYHLTYTLSDYANNTSEYSFTVRGCRHELPSPKCPNLMRLMRWNRASEYNLPNVRLTVLPMLLYHDVELQPSVKNGNYSDVVRFRNTSTPLHDWTPIRLRCLKAVKDPSKLYVVCHWGRDLFLGGTYKDGWVTGRMRELGADYELGYDDEPPLVHLVSQGNDITLGVTDSGCGLSWYKTYVDGKFVLFEQIPKSQWIRCHLADTPVRKTGKTHVLKVICEDNRKNRRTFETSFLY